MKNLCIFIITFVLVIAIGLYVNQAYAYEVFDVYLNENTVTNSSLLSALQNDTVEMILKKQDCYVVLLHASYIRYFSESNYTEIQQSGAGTYSKIDRYYFDLNGNYLGDDYRYGGYGRDSAYVIKDIVSVVYSSVDITYDLYGEVVFTRNNLYKFKSGQKFSIYNGNESVMHSKFSLNRSSAAMAGTIMLLDEYGQFIEQYSFSSGSSVSIDLPPLKTTNVIFGYLPQFIDDYLYLDFNKYVKRLNLEEYTPTFKIVGGSTVSLNSITIPGKIPYLISNYTTSVFYQYVEAGITYTKILSLPANQKVDLDMNTNYLIKFRHEPTTTISVKSNFVLNDTSERISLLSDDDLSDLIINNGGVLTENKNDNYYEIDRFKYVKITGLRQGTVTNPVQIDIQGDSNSNALIHIYDYNWNKLFKSNEILQQGNNGRYRVTVPSNGGYIVIKESAGKTYVRIDAKYKKDTDYTIQYLDSFAFDDDIEAEYHAVNPTPKPIQDINDNGIKPIKDNPWDAILSGGAWTGIGGDEQTDGITTVFKTVSDLITGFYSSVSSMVKDVDGMTGMFAVVTSAVPEPIVNVLTSSVILFVILKVFGR